MVRNRPGGPPGVYDWSEDPFRDLGRVEGYFRRSQMGGEVIQKIWDGLGYR